MTSLERIKTAHTIVWVFFVTLIAYVIYSGLTGIVTTYTWIAVGFVFLEGIILAANGGRCPMTGMAEQHAPADSHNFDIYLPEWLAKHNVGIFTTLFMAGLGLVIWRACF